MGTVYSRGDVLWLGFTAADGRRRHVSSRLRVGQESEARVMVAAIEEEIRKGTRRAEIGPLSVTEWGVRWQDERLARVPKVWNAKSEWRQVELHALPVLVDDKTRFGRMRIEDVRPRHALAFIRGLRRRQLAPRSVANIWGTVHKIFADAVIEELLSGNPMVLPDTERPRRVDADPTWRSKAVYTRAEAEALVTGVDLDDDRRMLYALALLGGLREGEVSDRRWRDYDPDAEPLGRLSVHSSYRRANKVAKGTKTEAVREVPVHPLLAAMLAQWKLTGWEERFGRKPKPDDLIVPNRKGRHHTEDSVMKGLRRDVKLLGLREGRRYHDMRRTFISLALAGGAPEVVLERVTHNAKGNVISQYNTVPWDALCAAVKCLKFGVRGRSAVRAVQG